MKALRRISTRRLLLALVLVVIVAGGTAAIVSAAGGGGPVPPPAPLDQAIRQALTAPAPKGVSGRITFTNRLFPSGALLGQTGSALMSGASGRFWMTADGRGRVELQSDAGDVQIVWSPQRVTVYDASSNTVYRADLPVHRTASTARPPHAAPTLSQIDTLLGKLGLHASVSGAVPTDIAGRPAYSVSLAPKHDGGLLGSAALAWDAVRGVPLRVAVYAQGDSKPVLELRITDISYGAVPSGAVAIAPPAGAKLVRLTGPGAGTAAGEKRGHGASTSGIAAVRAAAGFAVSAPARLVGLPLRQVRLVGSGTVLALYGHGLGGIVVVEQRADPHGTAAGLETLPRIALDGLTAHELATQLGTVLEWQSDGVSHILAASMPPAAAEAAAKAIR